MKKLFIILSVFCLCVALAAGPALGASYLQGKKYGIFNILGIQADHTYHCAGSSCWSWTGGESGGSYISYSGGYGDYNDAKCTSSNWGCRFVYAVQGVCHQEANRGLYTSGKTIARGGVGGYWLTGSVFGTYGESVSWGACKTACWLWW
jgi:hypothetical protein